MNEPTKTKRQYVQSLIPVGTADENGRIWVFRCPLDEYQGNEPLKHYEAEHKEEA